MQSSVGVLRGRAPHLLAKRWCSGATLANRDVIPTTHQSVYGVAHRCFTSSALRRSHEDVAPAITQKKLFTPGPLGVSMSTKEAMLYDLGSRDEAFIQTVQCVRDELVDLSGESRDDYTCIPVQGSGTFAVEAALTTSIPRTRPNILVLVNGAYGHRIGEIITALGISDCVKLSFPENVPMDLDVVERKIIELGHRLTNVAVVHCETSSGQINPVEAIGQMVAKHASQASFFIDAMSSFGSVPFSLSSARCDFMVTSANKCLQGVPGFSLVLANLRALKRCGGNSRSLSLDLCKQYHGLQSNGQFRFTPPTHCILALHQALKELREEGGIAGRRKRYQENSHLLRTRMAELGFKELLENETEKSFIITSFRNPEHPNFDFKTFYSKLSERGMCIYPGKVTAAECFRIGTIGNLHPDDIRQLLAAIEEVTKEMDIALPLGS
ncbi:2-aminoethylphosphonate--pyruvate transaminase-like [Sycon ciliatum]|uniref:2-aminoethylphosphonate--pyruvate transaminase-like n=1 Tax=Sycon ciliatum TaxID=27933 RepID=UPI0031F63C58